MKKEQTLIAAVLVLVVAIFGWFFFQNMRTAPTPSPAPRALQQATTPATTPTGIDATSPSGMTVQFTDAGFTPTTLTIQQGDTVTFLNGGTSAMWSATALHPTHRIYPGSDVTKCDTAAAAGMFDACQGIAAGQSWSFTFDEVGSWKYHDHLNPSKTGTIVVE